MERVISLEAMDKKKFFKARRKILDGGGKSPPIFTTEDEDIFEYDSMRVNISMSTFLRKKRNGDFAVVEDNDGVLVGYSKFMFL